jgi:molybdenum cofactor synthesis domain-containing protein
MSTAAVVIIGAEVLSGKVDDANGPFLIRSLRARGVELVEMRTIGDSVSVIAEAIAELSPKFTYVFTTGGIGPTHDDVTVQGVAKGLDLPVVRDAHLGELLTKAYGDKITDAAMSMADIPQGADVRFAEGGFVPVIWAKNVIVMPGVPSFMRACFNKIAPRLVGTPFYSRGLLLNVGESSIAAILSGVQNDFVDLAIGSYPQFNEASYKVKVTVDGRDEVAVQAALDALRDRLTSSRIVGEF